MSTDDTSGRREIGPTFVKVATFRQWLTGFLGDYDLGKLNDPSLKTEDIADDLLRTPEMQDLRHLLWALHDDTKDFERHGEMHSWAFKAWTKFAEKYPHVGEWVRSDP